METSLLSLLKNRRSVYEVGRDTELSKEAIVSYLKDVVSEVPTAFNAQTQRVVIVTGEANDEVWNIIYGAQKSHMADSDFSKMENTFTNPKEGIGTVLLFEDHQAVEEMPANEERSYVYKQHNSAMTQLAIWLALAEIGLGASLQHHNIGYEEGFDKDIRHLLSLPDYYELIAEMPFGTIEAKPMAKFKEDENKLVQLIDTLD